MTPEEEKKDPGGDHLTGDPPVPRRKHRPSLLGYLILLFMAAFLLLLLSYFMQQRRSDQDVITGLQENISAMQNVNALIEQNQGLQQQCDQLEEQIAAQKEELEQLKRDNEALYQTIAEQEEDAQQSEQAAEKAQNLTLALDWLWRIEREYFQGRYTNARNLIQEFEETGLKDSLPDEPLVDQEYRTPLFQYQAIYDILF